MVKPLKLMEIETMPTVNAIEALRRNLLYTVLRTVEAEDMEEIVQKQVEKAKAGDGKAARMLMDMVQAGQPVPEVSVQQQVVVAESGKPDWRQEARKIIACLIAFSGPQTTQEVAAKLRFTAPGVTEVLECDWFEKDGGKWHLTNTARNLLLDMPARESQQEAGIEEEVR